MENRMEKIVSLAKRRGFIYQGSEIYDGLAGTWDYGPLGVELKNNIKNLWWRHFVRNRGYIYGLDAAILMNSRVWEASGHVSGFTDPLIECKKCKGRFRADELEYKLHEKNSQQIKWEMSRENKCPSCNASGDNFSEPKRFNMMFKTNVGASEDNSSVSYLRPETAQGIFVNFKNVVDSFHPKLPFGIAQIGKAFRNEIAPRDFIFRTREFEQMEIEYFIKPDGWEKEFDKWVKDLWNWIDSVGINKDKVSELNVPKDELAHYSKKTIDFEYDFPFGRSELYGLAYRTDFDLKSHQEFSKSKLEYLDEESGEKMIPHVIEPSLGVDRTVLALLDSSYTEENPPAGGGDETRVVLKFKPEVAPIKIAILPLSKKEELTKPTKEIYNMLKKSWSCMYDETQSIGKRYRRQDEIGTPYCVTIDFDSLNDNSVTIRDRDTMEQERIEISKLEEYFKDRL